jgi:N-acetylmuramoyl-L-alanine amidase
MSKVFVGIGHGGSDPGACANGLRESDIVLDMGLELTRILRAHNVTVEISRTKDISDDLTPKINRCNKFDPDLAVDLHINAGGGVGFEAFHYHKGGTSKVLAQNIEAEVKKMGQHSRGLKTRLNADGQDYFGWIRMVNAPSVILEAAFIDNVDDVQKIRTIEGRKKFALAYAKGILNTLGIKYRENGSEGQENDMGAIYEKYEDIPEFGKPIIKKLMDKGALKGDSSGKINIPHEILRLYVVHDRLGVYDK